MQDTTLDELFSRDPLGLNDQDIATIILNLRKARTEWVQEEASAKAAGRRARLKAKVSIEDLDI